ncbi:hypothetical protein [Paraflavitalea pollutisoli]|uniref:hypothetical protein n=1 Tax=Paraflavitalea pollutisoli TaxID=3034143 RepID=UPI0023ECA3F9|nr:hypothetical protein [Paraflavitalea sp. H1-2-19X]
MKTDEPTAGKEEANDAISFPANETFVPAAAKSSNTPLPATPVADAVVSEVIEVYESGLESINMPGYDFYEFYKAISSTGQTSEHTYQLAFQMARSMDKTITVQKLLQDAEFYISKINEVHGQYVGQGQSKLQALEEQKRQEKGQLQGEIDHATARITQLKAELQQLESGLQQKQGMLGKIDDGFRPQEQAIRGKLQANDSARSLSIGKLQQIREGIARYIKQ